MTEVVIIGSGSVAEHLVLETERAPELRLAQVFARNRERGPWLAQKAATTWTDDPESLATADLYIISVTDSAVGPLSASLKFAETSVVAHTAGCVHIDEIYNEIENRAVLYPLQSFTRGRDIGEFRRIPFFIEGTTPRALETVRTAARAFSDNVVEMDSDRRARIHLAGSWANNFPNLMFTVAQEIVDAAGVSFDLIKPIIEETVAKALSMPSPGLAQTGPAQRGDEGIQAKHVAMLEASHPRYVELYKLLSKIIWEKTSKKDSQK